MLKDSRLSKANETIHYDVAKLRDIYLLQGTLKKIYGKSPWNYTVFWIELMNKKESFYLKMHKGDVYIGFVGLKMSELEAHITNLAILPKYQNQGFGTTLLNKAIQCAREKKCLTLSLEVKKSNTKAISIYEQTGFFKVGVKKKYYKENQEDAIDMVFILDDA